MQVFDSLAGAFGYDNSAQLEKMKGAFNKVFNPLPSNMNEVFDSLMFKDGMNNVDQVNRMRDAFNRVFNPISAPIVSQN